MANLSTGDRQRIWRGLMRYMPFGWSGLKAELMDAVVATDEWQDSNQASYNNALPEPFKTAASPLQKTILFCVVAIMRAIGAEWLRRLLGEVD